MNINYWNRLWDKWDLRGVIILSLTLQALLILSAPLRKRTSRGFVLFPLWLAYLLADTVAIFAIGLISKSRLRLKEDLSVRPSSRYDNEGLLTFWAPFLLVHLGGPDTITAFALEDNQLWLRHLLQLLSQSVTAAYVFILSLSLSESDLWLPTLLMFVAGLIKYAERTRSLYLASSRRFRESLLTEPDPGPNYAKLMDEFFFKKSANLPTYIGHTGEPVRKPKTADQQDTKESDLTDIDVIKHAHRFFETFKGLIADLIFSFRERNHSREFFLNRNPKNAFKVVEVELNFFYEILYTKIVVIQGRIGYCFRFISFSSFVASFVVFASKEKKKLYPTDIRITYALFIGGIALDILAFLMLILSDWTAIALTKSKDPSLIIKFLRKLLCVDRRRWVEDNSETPFRLKLVLPLLRRRWSECISQYNLIDYCLRPRSKNKEKLIGFFGLTNILDELKYVGRERFDAELRGFIFEELRLKSQMAEDLETAKEICLARGDWVLRTEGCSELLPYVLEVNYDESLILWHIATELLHSTAQDDEKNKSSYKYAKLLSDYMLYLLIMQQTMLSPVAGIGQIRFRDTCAEAKIFFQRKKIGGTEEKKSFLRIPCACVCCKRDRGRKESSVNPSMAKSGKRNEGARETHSCANIFCCFKNWCSKEKKGPDADHGQEQSPVNQSMPASRVSSSGGQTSGGVGETQSRSNIFCGFSKCCCEEKGPNEHKRACKAILDVNTEAKPIQVKGDRSKSVLFDGSILAKELMKLEERTEDKKDKWKIMSKVWVELLSYGACNCRPTAHAAQLSKGGQLITHVWLLMAHLGLGEQFQINEGHARARLIVEK